MRSDEFAGWKLLVRKLARRKIYCEKNLRGAELAIKHLFGEKFTMRKIYGVNIYDKKDSCDEKFLIRKTCGIKNLRAEKFAIRKTRDAKNWLDITTIIQRLMRRQCIAMKQPTLQIISNSSSNRQDSG